ncbi:hypothetical protein BH09SUM1_BH09SUM1_27520 [soil metagenome]
MFVAVGGVFLVTWYGLSRMRGRGVEHLSVQESTHRAAQEIAITAMKGEFRQSFPSFEFAGGSVFCVCCAMEYPAGVLFCEACGLETAEADDGDDAQPMAHPAEEVEMICVHIAESLWTASLLKNFLESHEIFCMIENPIPRPRGESAPQALEEVHVGVTGVFVATADEAHARQLLRRCV